MSGIVFDPSSCTLAQDDRSVALSPSEAAVFRAIFDTERTATFDAIVQEIYREREEANWSNTVVKVLVHRIRRKASSAGILAPFRSVRGVGYQRDHAVTMPAREAA